jgi:predicted XRE-type DNA-binding protein
LSRVARAVRKLRRGRDAGRVESAAVGALKAAHQRSFFPFAYPLFASDPPMIPATVIAQIQDLLAEGKLSQRKIARIVSVSRATVGLVAAGKRLPIAPRLSELEAGLVPSGPPVRCRGCGGLVYWPCRLCGVRAWIKRRKQHGSRAGV